MAGSVNKVIIVGNLGQDPEIRTFQNGGKIANLRIATSETWKDKNSGERREKTEWHSIVLHAEPLVRLAEQYLRKGMKVYIEGQLETRKWQDQSGADRYSTEIALRPFRSELTMLDSPRGDDQQQGNRQQSARQASYDAQRPQSGGYGGSANLDESEIPFAPEVRI